MKESKKKPVYSAEAKAKVAEFQKQTEFVFTNESHFLYQALYRYLVTLHAAFR